MATQPSAVDRMLSIELSPSELAILDRPQAFLDELEPHSKRGQQVRRLEQHGPDFYKSADAVKTCGRLGEKWGYECGREFLRKILRAHLRFCCEWCDSYCASKLFEEHRFYRAFLNPSGILYRVTIRSGQCLPSRDSVNDLEDASVKAVQGWLRKCNGWGFKSYTHYENSSYVIKGMIYLPPDTSIPPDDLNIPFGACKVDSGASVAAFEEMLAGILKPTLMESNGVLRADLMAAFQSGKHLRSQGVLNGKTTQKRKEKRLERELEKLHLIAPSQSGATLGRPDGPITSCPHASNIRTQDISCLLESESTSVKPQDLTTTYVPDKHEQSVSSPSVLAEPLVRPEDRSRSAPSCPHCGPGCKLISISVEPMSDFQDTPSFGRYALFRLKASGVNREVCFVGNTCSRHPTFADTRRENRDAH